MNGQGRCPDRVSFGTPSNNNRYCDIAAVQTQTNARAAPDISAVVNHPTAFNTGPFTRSLRIRRSLDTTMMRARRGGAA